MLAGRAPWANPNRDVMYKNIVSQPAKMLDYFSPKAKDLLRRLLQIDVLLTQKSFRLSDAHEAMRHPFFASIDWCRLLERKTVPPCIPTSPESAGDEPDLDNPVFDHFTYEEPNITL